MTREGIQDQDHVHGEGELHLHQDIDGQEAGQEDDPIQNQGAGDDLKVLGGEGLIPESGLEGLGAHPKPETKRRKKRRRNDLKLHQRVTAQPDDPEAQAEKGGAEEAGVAPGPLKSPDPPRERFLGPLHQKDIKRRKKRIKTKRKPGMNERGPQARRRKAKTKRRIGRESPRVTRMSNRSHEIMMKKNKATIVRKRKRKKRQKRPLPLN